MEVHFGEMQKGLGHGTFIRQIFGTEKAEQMMTLDTI